MSIKWIGDAWQTYLEDAVGQDRRVYVDFRQKQYPEVAGSPTFSLMTAADNQPGSHNLSGGNADYLLDMPSTFTLDIYFKPTFAYDTADDQYLCGWRIDAAHYWELLYLAASDCYELAWIDGATERQLVTPAYVSDVTLQVWTRLTLSVDLTTGTTAGSALYRNGALVDAVWSGASEIKASYFPLFSVRHIAAWPGAFVVNYLRLFSGKVATAAEVANNFQELKDEEIVWHFNGCALGHTRCNVTDKVLSVDLERSIESPVGISNPNGLSVQLVSQEGEFADDQYAAFNAATEHYNGTLAQRFMRHRTPIEVETWYGGLFELEFTGRVNEDMFSRRSAVNELSVVNLSAQDVAADLKRRVRQKAYKYENYNLCDPSVASSLLHVIAQMGLQREWYNFLSNASFERTTISSSWVVSGTGASIARGSGGVLGSYEGQLDYSTATAMISQTVDFTGTKKLNVGQTWDFALYVKCTSAANGTLVLSGLAAAVETESQHVHFALSGGEGWRRYDVAYSVATSAIDHLKCAALLTSDVALSLDCGMLVQNDQALEWFVPNDNDGASGEDSADDADSAVFDTVGFDVEDAMIVHPFAVVEQGTKIWDYLTNIADATAARYFGFDACGTLKYRTPFKTGYADPSTLTTIDSVVSVDSMMTIEQANKIIIHGVRIVKEQATSEVWSALKSSFFDRDANGYVYETVLDTSTWPAPNIYGEFWAKYEEGPKGSKGWDPLVITGIV
jgi:hypothetical protein